VPKRLHKIVLSLVEPHREEEDSCIPVYRMNTRSKLRQLFPQTHFRQVSGFCLQMTSLCSSAHRIQRETANDPDENP
jgi:hypothetical protein